MRIVLVAIGLVVLLAVGWVLKGLMSDRDERDFAVHYSWIVKWALTLSRETQRTPAGASFDSPRIEVAGDPNRWLVSGKVNWRDSAGAPISEPYTAVVANICKAYADPGCWRLDGFEVGEAAIDLAEATMAGSASQVAHTPTATDAEVVTGDAPAPAAVAPAPAEQQVATAPAPDAGEPDAVLGLLDEEAPAAAEGSVPAAPPLPALAEGLALPERKPTPPRRLAEEDVAYALADAGGEAATAEADSAAALADTQPLTSDLDTGEALADADEVPSEGDTGAALADAAPLEAEPTVTVAANDAQVSVALPAPLPAAPATPSTESAPQPAAADPLAQTDAAATGAPSAAPAPAPQAAPLEPAASQAAPAVAAPAPAAPQAVTEAPQTPAVIAPAPQPLPSVAAAPAPPAATAPAPPIAVPAPLPQPDPTAAAADLAASSPAVAPETELTATTVAALPPTAEPESQFPHDPALVVLIQDRLDRAGYNPGPVDGRFGSRTESALREFEQDAGLPVTGTPSRTALAALDRLLASRTAVPAPAPAKPQVAALPSAEGEEPAIQPQPQPSTTGAAPMPAPAPVQPSPPVVATPAPISPPPAPAAVAPTPVRAPTNLQQPLPGASQPPADESLIFLIQHRLRQAGFSPGRFDGRMSEGTANAIRAYQSRSGLPVDGVPSRVLLERLEADVLGAGQRRPLTPTPLGFIPCETGGGAGCAVPTG
jgi:peptidoglycan hydrolase-like protein with peptidoglycan-binding domain